jgi:hypothetical protein
VKNIGPEWRNLAEGLLRVEALEARFHKEWGPRLEEARRKVGEAERQKYRKRGQTALVAASVLGLLLFVVALVLSLISPSAATVALVLVLVIPTVPAVYGAWALLRSPAIPPDLSHLSGRWWGTISGRALPVRRFDPALPARRYGDEGEEAFVSHLTAALPDGYVAVRGLLVARRLDADVIIVGSTGIWVYEVKNWSGQITCLNGQWQRVKTYHQPGGRLVQESQVLRPFDKQWAKEAGAVRGVLRRRLPRNPNLPGAVGGGLVITHGRASFFADGSCQAQVYTPSSCAEALSGSPSVLDLTMQERLLAIDALLEESERLHEQQGEAPPTTSSSVELAERLYVDAVSRAVAYLSEVSDTVSVAVSEEATKPDRRGIWHPYPDDPPKI